MFARFSCFSLSSTGGDDWRWRTFRRLNELNAPVAPGDEDLLALLERQGANYDRLNDVTRYWLARLAMSRQNLNSLLPVSVSMYLLPI